MIKTLYLNIEDDVAQIVTKVKAQRSSKIVLVIPKSSYLFADAINLKLLKKQTDLLEKSIVILTLDSAGQDYAKAAGFALKDIPQSKRRSTNLSDVTVVSRKRTKTVPQSNQPSQLQEPQTLSVPRALKEPVIRKRRKVVSKSKGVTKVGTKNTLAKSRSPQLRSAQTVQKLDNVFIPPEDSTKAIPKRRSFKRWLLAFVVLSLGLSLVLGLVVLPGATVTIEAKPQVVSRDLDVVIDQSITNPDYSRLTLPATKIDRTDTLNDQFEVKGKKEIGSKAEGRVAIYNLTGNPLTLKAGTTVLTVGDKNYLFKIDQTNINALTSPQNDSNATVADIIAENGGEAYNLPAGTRVEITNQAFGSQPNRLYATTISQVIGGSSRFISAVSAEDLTASQQFLGKKLVEEINNELIDSQKLVDGAYRIESAEYLATAQEGDELTNFDASAKVTIIGFAFDERALRDMVRSRLISTLGDDKQLQEAEADKVIYKIKNLDLDSGILELSVHYESQALPVLDAVDIKNNIAGKTQTEASDLILNNPGVSGVVINLRPFWQKSLPRLTNKIEIIINTLHSEDS
ncbi:MAG: hypothetical protein R3B41_03215 [Candidatus Doudnabacteria bacterium]